MKRNQLLRLLCLCAAMLLSGAASRAQSTFSNPAGGDWNTDANWTPIGVPGDTTNAFMTNLVAAYAVNYNAAMLAPDFASLLLTNSAGVGSATLNINSTNFNVTGAITVRAGGKINVSATGAINSGSMAFINTGNLVMSPGCVISNTGTLGIGNSGAGAGAFTNNSAFLTTGGVTIGSSSDGGPMVLTGSNVSSLGNFLVGRCGGSSTALPALTTGLIVSNGLVTLNSLVLGSANSWGNMTMVNGIVTNVGDFILGRQGTAARGGRYTQTGGLVVSTTNSGIRFCVINASQIATYAVLGGTNITEGFVMGDSSVSSGTVNFTNAAVIVIGAVGITNASVNAVAAGTGTTLGTTNNVNLNNGGIFYAKADWTASVPLTLASSSSFTFNSGDLDGTPHNITVLGGFKGSGNLIKLGAGSLLLNGTNSNGGSVLVNAGTLAIGPTGTLTAASPVLLASGTTLDVSQLVTNGGFVLGANKVLGGFGAVTGPFTVGASATVNPGSNTTTGTLTFSNDLLENGGAVNHFDLPGDTINVAQNLTVSGVNTLEISGTLPGGTKYALIHYGAAFNGTLTNFVVTGASGVLSNSVVDQTIYLVIASSIRGPANVTWLGNASSNVWDSLEATNWLNNGIADFFVSGDNVRFDATGAANPLVTVTGSVAPATVTVDSATDYTFTGNGSIDGTGSLTKTNSANLTILTTNNYTGVTTISGGTLTIAQVANGGTPGALGAASSDQANLVITNATLDYTGTNAGTDRGATIGGTANFVVASPTNALTIAGTIVGSGGVTMSGPGTLILSGANSYGGPTTMVGGTLQNNANSTALNNTLVFAGGALDLNVSGQPIYPNPVNVLTTGTLISAGGNNNVFNGVYSGAGTLSLNLASGTFTINSTLTNFTGTFLLTDASAGTFRFNSGGNNTSAQACAGSPTATFDMGNSTATLLNRNGGGASFGTYFLGALTGVGTGSFIKGDANSSSGSTYQIGDKGLSTTYAGSIQDGGGGSGATTGILKVGSGTLTLSGNNNTYTGSTTISNGILALITGVNGDGSIASSSIINITSGAFLDVTGRSDHTLPLNAGQVLEGRGTLLGQLNTGNGGTVSPGGGLGGNTGILTVSNAVVLGGNAVMKLNRTNSQTSDLLVSLSTLTYGGTLTVTNIGPALVPGDTFTLFSGQALNGGTFNTLNLPHYFSWDTSGLATNGTIKFLGALPPPSFNLFDTSQLAFGQIVLSGTNGSPNSPYVVLSSTNLAAPKTNWTTAFSGNFDGNGAFDIGLTVDPSLPEQFFVIQGF